LVYGKVLALFQVGKMKQAEKALDIATRCYPLITAELLKTKHRKPKGMDERRVTLGRNVLGPPVIRKVPEPEVVQHLGTFLRPAFPGVKWHHAPSREILRIKDPCLPRGI
jgi:hypothetical protein